MKVTATFIEGYRFEMTSPSMTIISDQSPEYGGEGKGPMPSEMLLWSLGACLGQSIAYIAKKKRITLEGLELEVSGSKDMDGFRYGQLKVLIRAHNPADQLNKVLVSARKLCFVSNTLQQGIDVEYVVEE